MNLSFCFFTQILCFLEIVSQQFVTAQFQSFSKSSSKQPKYKLSSVYSESAIIDKETGQVFWQNGSPRLSDTWSLTGIENSPSSTSTVGSSNNGSSIHTNLRHVKPTILSIVLWVAILHRIKDFIVVHPFITLAQIKERYPRLLYHICRVLFFIMGTLLLPFNPFAPWFVGMCAVLYIVEAFTCTTRRYLINALSSSEEMEEYLESLRQVKPNVIWKVRCFHYETQPATSQKDDTDNIANNTDDNDDNEEDDSDSNEMTKAMIKSKPKTTTSSNKNTTNKIPRIPKKVITHRATKQYEFDDWEDQTMVSLWKRAPIISSLMSLSSPSSSITGFGGSSSSSSTISAPYTKISFSKFLLLANAKAREDYFRQQREFVQKEAYKDVYTEFFTDIQVDGFKSKILAHRTLDLPDIFTKNKKIYKKLQTYQFWVYTLLGLTVPFRFWMDKHCDTLCVTLVKEISASSPRRKKKKELIQTTTNTNGAKDSYWSTFFPNIAAKIYGTQTHAEQTTNNATDINTNGSSSQSENKKDNSTTTNSAELHASDKVGGKNVTTICETLNNEDDSIENENEVRDEK